MREADELCEKGEYDRAREIIIEAINRDSNNIMPLKKLGNFYHRIGEYEKAILTYLKALNISPNNQVLLYPLSCTFMDMKQYRNAIECLYLLKKQYKEHPEVDCLLAEAYYNLNDYEFAKIYLSKAGKRTKEYVKLYNQTDDILKLARIYKMLGDINESEYARLRAIEYYKRYLSEEQEDEIALIEMCFIFEDLGIWEEIKEIRKKLIDIGSERSKKLVKYIDGILRNVK